MKIKHEYLIKFHLKGTSTIKYDVMWLTLEELRQQYESKTRVLIDIRQLQ